MRMRAHRTTAILTAVSVALLAGAWFFASTSSDRATPVGADPAAGDSTAGAGTLDEPHSETTRLAAERAASRRESTSTARPGPTRQATGLAPTRVVVFDVEGHGVAGVELASNREAQSTDAGGRCEFDGDPGVVRPRSPWMVLAASPDGGRERALIVARGVALQGRVESGDGSALAGAKLEIRMFTPLPTRVLPEVAWHVAALPRTTSERDGQFRIEAPAIGGALLTADAPNCVQAAIAVPNGPRQDLVLRLAPPDETGRAVNGFVTHRDGSPAPAAIVRAGPRWASVGPDGSFRIRIPPPNEGGLVALIATEIGHQTALARDPGQNPVRLVLGGPPLSIRGRVVDEHGAPKAGWRVELIDGEPYDRRLFPAESSESAAAPRPSTFRTEANGAFELNGLSDRNYSIQAWSETELIKVVAEMIPAGRDDLVMVVRDDATIAKLEGRVVSRDGTGVARAHVRVKLLLLRAAGMAWMEPSPTAITDVEGRFVLANVPAQFSLLDVGGDDVMATSRELTGIDLSHPLVVEVARRCSFQFAPTADQNVPDGFEVRDGDDRALPVQLWREPGTSASRDHWGVKDVAVGRLSVSEDARAIVFFNAANEELARRSVRLLAGQNTVVGW